MAVQARLIGYPRIGPQRELKWTLEKQWAGRTTRDEFEQRIAQLRRAHLDEQRGLVGSAVDDFFLYDAVLETALAFGMVPERLRGTLRTDPFTALSELARGTPDHEAWEMTKWYDTNYHYVVPEVESRVDAFTPLPWREPSGDPGVSWPLVGPYSLVKLSKLSPGTDARELAADLGRALWAWVRSQPAGFRLQVDEPHLGLVATDDDRQLLEAAYADAGGLSPTSAPIVTVQFGQPAQETMEFLGTLGFAVQMPLGALALAGTAAWASQPEHVISVMEGRSPWRDSFDAVAEAFANVDWGGKAVSIVPATSLLFLPYTVEVESGELRSEFWFAREKARELGRWAEALTSGTRIESARSRPVEWPEVGDLTPRAPRAERRAAQADLGLPPYPTTTIGSLPQTSEVRSLRTRLDRGEIDRSTYDREIDFLIVDGIRWQERIGLDVLVHGEFERTDMVEYFAAQMDDYLTTRHGWVLSYGSRCVRPPILAAPPTIREPMTVREWRVAQDATDKPVKGMLTGPVTMVNWSFRPPGVPDDRLFWAVAHPIAEEIRYLIDAGCRVIQVDEPAVRERWPLPTVDAEERREIYARGVRVALNRVFSFPPQIQMHTHMCYGTNAEIAPLWTDSGVDVSSIWYARSKDDDRIRAFYEVLPDGRLEIGPGVFDVHSPYSPGADVMLERLEHFGTYMDPADIWVNPDCGLKTRRWEEIEVQLADMVKAATGQRARSGERVPV